MRNDSLKKDEHILAKKKKKAPIEKCTSLSFIMSSQQNNLDINGKIDRLILYYIIFPITYL